jgi:hypothetical protein
MAKKAKAQSLPTKKQAATKKKEMTKPKAKPSRRY